MGVRGLRGERESKNYFGESERERELFYIPSPILRTPNQTF